MKAELIPAREEIEQELTWRKDEMRFFRNQLFNINKESRMEKYRKSLIVMLYSHFEGFCKFCFLLYVNEINKTKILREEASTKIVAASMNKVFDSYENTRRKSKIFKKSFPDDKTIHNFFRRISLLSEFNNFMKKEVDIPDTIVNTEANLHYNVLQKNLYKLDFDYKCFKVYKKDINKLVHLRNNIAHGSSQTGFSEKDYNKLEESIFNIMEELLKLIIKNLDNKTYLKD